MGFISIIVMIISAIGFAISFINYSILSKTEITNLNWKVRETFQALSILAVIMIAKAITSIQQLRNLEIVVNVISVLYVLTFNVVLLNTIIKSALNLTLGKDCVQIPFYIAVLWLIFEEKVTIDPIVVDFTIAILALIISLILLKLARYIRILSLIVIPVDMRTSLLVFLIFMMFYLASTLAYQININVSRSLLVVSLMIAILSIILLDIELRKTVRF